MRSADYEKLFLELLGPLPTLGEGDPIRKQFEEMTAADLDRLVPIIDDMTEQAENRGRLATYLEIVAERLKNAERRESTINTAN